MEVALSVAANRRIWTTYAADWTSPRWRFQGRVEQSRHFVGLGLLTFSPSACIAATALLTTGTAFLAVPCRQDSRPAASAVARPPVSASVTASWSVSGLWPIGQRVAIDAQWSAYFTRDVPGEAVVDFLVALDASDQPAVPLAGSELVLDAVAAHGWFRDIDQPQAAASDPTFTSHISLGEVPPLIQDADPRALSAEDDERGPAGWQAWAEPALGAPLLWVASFAASVPHDLVAAFAASLSATAPVLRRVLPEATQERLLRAPAI
ncbi:DUF317 domain-containing protein [Streptomyces sp. NPDC092370]|uniref:DUF317 domain-containing protein n=1 Tax=Streptomyces sp. NPDC092370 TaxID=3366016 RepID=UPI0038024800